MYAVETVYNNTDGTSSNIRLIQYAVLTDINYKTNSPRLYDFRIKLRRYNLASCYSLLL
jgi:hypothetical protein